ncbi:hypothetical protein LPJ66_011015, partial [Kickxella alabastrina]
PGHTSMAQYHAQHQHQHQQQVGPIATSAHHAGSVAAVGGDAAGAYQASGFSPYAHPPYHPQHSAAGFDPNNGSSVDSASTSAALATGTGGVDHEYSVIDVAGALHTSTTPIHIQQQQHQQQHVHPHIISNNGMRFDYILEAPTAAAQKADEPTLTYLNKGQLYGISMMDKMHSDTFYSTTLRISFHEDSHRKGAATYWNFWLNQQENPRVARAIELDKAGSIGVVSAETKQFDRVTFQWQGRRGAKIMIRFNCLSTDFSRIKGVKGIPLRIHLDTHYAIPAPMGASDAADFAASIGQMSSPNTSLPSTNAMIVSSAESHSMAKSQVMGSFSTPVPPATAGNHPASLDTQSAPSTSTAATFSPISANSSLASGKIIERCYARIKLFRDKGAERKNKDDQRHLEKLWEKQKAKLSLTGSNGGSTTTMTQQQMAEFTTTFAPVQQVTSFVEYTLTGDDCDAEEPVIIEDLWAANSSAISVAVAAAASADLESAGSSLSTPITGISSLNLGMPGMHLGGLSSPLTPAAAAVAYMRKRSADDLDLLSPNKRQFSPASLPSGINSGTLIGPNDTELIGVDPTYVPMARKRKSVMSIYIKFQGENVYRAVYLERLTVDDLLSKLAQRLEIQTTPDVEIIRKTRKGLTVKVDNNVISQLEDQQDMEVECSFAEDTGNLTIYLHY